MSLPNPPSLTTVSDPMHPQATENFNADDFATACADFDRISPLDPFKTSMLVAVRYNVPQYSY